MKNALCLKLAILACLLPLNQADAATAENSTDGDKRQTLLAAGKKNAEKQAAPASSFAPALDEIEKLVMQFYPRAKVVKKGQTLEVKYKTKPGISVYTNRQETMPDLDGLIMKVEIRPGRYKGSERLETDSNQFYYTRYTLAPYLASEDKHLFAQISFPANASHEFLNEFKSLVAATAPREIAKTSEDKKPDEKKASASGSSSGSGSGSASASASGSGSKTKTPEKKSTRTKTASARPPARTGKSKDRSSRNIFLFKATRDDDLIYLMGTIHVAKPNFYPLPRGILDAFNESNHLYLEIPINDESFIKKSEEIRSKMKGTYDPPDKLKDKLSPETKKAFEEYLAWSGETWDMYNKYRPWLANNILSGSLPRRGELEEYKGRYGIDNYLCAQAMINDVTVGGLEPPDREFFAKLEEPVQDKILFSSLLDLKNREKDIKEIFEIWKSGDVEGMAQLDADEEKKFPELRAFHKVMLDDRNENMVKRLMEIIKEKDGPYFVAVGSAHLGGPAGMIKFLEKEGFKVEQMQNPRPNFAGLEVEDLAAAREFAEGPCLEERKHLYNVVKATGGKGIGIQGYLNNLDRIETLVKDGAHQYDVEREIDRVETALAKQAAPFLKQEVTDYCIEVENKLGQALKSVKGLETGSTLACTIEADGTVRNLRKSKTDKSPAATASLAVEKVKAVGKFPPPPHAPLRLTLLASSNPSRVEAWHRGVTDTSEFVTLMREKIRSKWHLTDMPRSSGVVVTVFRILRNGTIDHVKIIKSSGSESMDQAVYRAILNSSPLVKLPDGSRKSLTVPFTFAIIVVPR
ncbi:MAG: TonB family protein [Cyanobacteria bacterium HKST-UBA02]|nr:TonB family protein [Cyanobacteria bacterium HKST-UBA02]